MSAPQTPGQTAYAAWWQARYGMQQVDAASAYQMLPAQDRRAWDAAAQAVLALVVPRTFAEKSALNQWVAARYDALMQEGKHGHYETMFRVMQEALAQAVLAWKEEETP